MLNLCPDRLEEIKTRKRPPILHILRLDIVAFQQFSLLVLEKIQLEVTLPIIILTPILKGL